MHCTRRKRRQSMKYRVHIECRSAKMVECIAYVVQTDSAKEAKEKALHTARQYYPEFDEFRAYHVEELGK